MNRRPGQGRQRCVMLDLFTRKQQKCQIGCGSRFCAQRLNWFYRCSDSLLESRLQPVALSTGFDRLKPLLQCAQSPCLYLTSYICGHLRHLRLDCPTLFEPQITQMAANQIADRNSVQGLDAARRLLTVVAPQRGCRDRPVQNGIGSATFAMLRQICIVLVDLGLTLKQAPLPASGKGCLTSQIKARALLSPARSACRCRSRARPRPAQSRVCRPGNRPGCPG